VWGHQNYPQKYIYPSKEFYVEALGGLGYVHQTPRSSLNINS